MGAGSRLGASDTPKVESQSEKAFPDTRKVVSQPEKALPDTPKVVSQSEKALPDTRKVEDEPSSHTFRDQEPGILIF